MKNTQQSAIAPSNTTEQSRLNNNGTTDPTKKIKAVPEDFPLNKRVKNADPTAIILGPQSATIQQNISHTLSEIDAVSSVFARQTSPQNNGPLEFLLYSETTSPEELVRILSNTPSILPDGHAYTTATKPAHSNSSARPPQNPTLSIRVYQHPLLPDLRCLLNNLNSVDQYKITWDETGTALGMSSYSTDWDTLAPLYLSFTSTATDSQSSKTANALHEELITTTPWEYLTQINSIDPETSPHTSISSENTLYKIDFTPRTERTHELSAIYNTSATDIEELITSLRPKINDSEKNADNTNQITLTGDNTPTDDPTGIQLSITSPVYLNAIDYDSFAENSDEDWSGSDESALDTDTDKLIDAWKQQQENIFTPLYNATQNGGYCAVVIGHVKGENKNEWVDVPGHFSTVMREIGWTFHEKIVWNKLGAEGQRFGTTIQNNKPTYYYPNQVHEEIQIWRKGNLVNKPETDEELILSDLMMKELKTNVWTIPTVPHGKFDHPCPFPEELVYRLTALYSTPNDIVCDPLSGSGTTIKVADRLNRIGIGTELKSKFVSEGRRRLGLESFERNLQHIPSYEKVDNRADMELTTTDTEDNEDDTQTELTDL